jgi:hypothetical protein
MAVSHQDLEGLSSMRRCTSIILLTLVAALALTGVAHAQSQSLYWDRFDVNITVLPNGDFVVEEVQAIVFTSGEFHFGYRNIPMDRLERITDVEVWEGDRRYEPGQGTAYTFQTSVDGGDFVIQWYFPYTSNSSHTFVLRYTVQGGLRYYDGGDQLFWKAVYADRDFPVYNSTVTVQLPGGAAADPVAAYGAGDARFGTGVGGAGSVPSRDRAGHAAQLAGGVRPEGRVEGGPQAGG